MSSLFRCTLSAVVALAACSEATSPPEPTTTYHRDVRPLVEQACLSCHQTGGIGPFPLDGYERLKSVAPAALDAIENRRMPPWMPDPDCRRYVNERLLTDAQIDTFRQWYDWGMPEGDPAEYTAPTPGQRRDLSQLGPADIVGAPSEPYAPNPARPDDYRCFVVNEEFEEDAFMVASNVVPDQQALVHHVILYLVPPTDAPRVAEFDAAEPGPGYTCFGGVGVGSPIPVAGWVPGAQPYITDDGTAIRIPAGAKLVMQMHYNLLGGAPAADQTEVHVWTSSDRPDFLLYPEFVPNLGIDIPAGNPASTHTRVIRNTTPEPWTLVQTTPHMHLLGTRISTHKLAADGSEECVVDIPRWDFNWQQSYTFRPGEEVVVQPGEALRLECTYDNSAANQPVINGVQLEPVRVTWGEGTLDEMCLNNLVFIAPYTGSTAELTCAADRFQPCYDQCLGGLTPMTGCVLRCGADNGCAECALTGLVTCTTAECGPQAASFLQCLEGCGEDVQCVSTVCLGQILAFDACARPHFEAGTCDQSLVGCGVQL